MSGTAHDAGGQTEQPLTPSHSVRVKDITMEYTRLGSSGLRISRIALGCMSFGDPAKRLDWSLGDDTAEPIFRQAVELGVTFWDTANIYGLGTSEEIVGRALARYTNREDIVLAGKVRYLGPSSMWAWRFATCSTPPKRLDQVVQGLHGLLDRGVRIEAVNLIVVDVVDVQAPQGHASIMFHDCLAGQPGPARSVMHLAEELGGTNASSTPSNSSPNSPTTPASLSSSSR